MFIRPLQSAIEQDSRFRLKLKKKNCELFHIIFSTFFWKPVAHLKQIANNIFILSSPCMWCYLIFTLLLRDRNVYHEKYYLLHVISSLYSIHRLCQRNINHVNQVYCCFRNSIHWRRFYLLHFFFHFFCSLLLLHQKSSINWA